jgi:hypothetical protein
LPGPRRVMRLVSSALGTAARLSRLSTQPVALALLAHG